MINTLHANTMSSLYLMELHGQTDKHLLQGQTKQTPTLGSRIGSDITLSHPDIQTRGMTVISHLKLKGSKCETTQTFIFCNWILFPITKYLFRVNAQLSKFINSQNSKFHADKKIISKSQKCCLEYNNI